MKILTTTLSVFCIFLCGLSLEAQNTVSAGGSDATGAGGSASYTIGQVFYKTITGMEAGSVAEGVHQPYEISVVTELADAGEFLLDVKTYPNPANDFLILRIDGDMQTQCIASLYDINGILLVTKKIENQETYIPLTGFASGTYFLKIINNKKEVKTFKIIKY